MTTTQHLSTSTHLPLGALMMRHPMMRHPFCAHPCRPGCHHLCLSQPRPIASRRRPCRLPATARARPRARLTPSERSSPSSLASTPCATRSCSGGRRRTRGPRPPSAVRPRRSLRTRGRTPPRAWPATATTPPHRQSAWKLPERTSMSAISTRCAISSSPPGSCIGRSERPPLRQRCARSSKTTTRPSPGRADSGHTTATFPIRLPLHRRAQNSPFLYH